LADALVPDDVTLKAALDSATLADDPVLGIQLIERATRVKDTTTSPALAHALTLAEARFAHRTGRIVVRCNDCLALVDGAQLQAGAPRIVLVGTHLVALQRGGVAEERLVAVLADETREVVPGDTTTAPDAAATKARSETNDHAPGLSPLWFVVAAATTVGLGAATIASAVDTVNDHVGFDRAGCASWPAPSCAALAASGRDAQTWTSWLAVGSSAALAGTAALGIFGVRWHRGGHTVAANLAGTTVTVRLTF
jgi:hypothetical protein